MPVNIDEFKVASELECNKSQIGGGLSIPEFNIYANLAQLIPFEKDRQIFIATQNISDYLSTFLKNTTPSVPATGVLPYPSDYEHTASIRSYYVRPNQQSGEVSVDPVKNRDWGDISSSQLQQGTKRFPKYSEFSGKYRFLPRDIGTVMIDYFKTPVKPIWGYTIVSGRPVYDPTTSTDFEWDSFMLNNILANFVQLRAMNLRESDLLNYANVIKEESKSPL